MKYYLIHGVDASRKSFMKHQFEKYGIPENQVSWILWPNKTDKLPTGISLNKALPKGMVAVTYKHYLCLKDIVEKQYPLAVIMEDNIEFRGSVPEAIEKYLKDLPPYWDCVFDSDYFGFTYLETPTDSNISVYKKSNEKTDQCAGSSKGAHFILLNLNAAQKLFKRFIPFHEGSDHNYNEIFRLENMNVYWAEPPNVHKIQRKSTWEDDKKRFPWLK
jgi:GR25 family glycosyltransferase involved in LPS biosynthesis